jgi:hypothetical protein
VSSVERGEEASASFSDVEVILTWTGGTGAYPGDQGESSQNFTKDDLWDLITRGKREDLGGAESAFVSSITIFCEIPPL